MIDLAAQFIDLRTMSIQLLLINDWLIDTQTGDLWAKQTSIDTLPTAEPDGRLDPKGVEILNILIASPNQVISKETLIDAVWPKSIVTDDALSRSISRLRKLLNDSAKSPTIIETVPKRGYRLIGTIKVKTSSVPVSSASANPVQGNPSEREQSPRVESKDTPPTLTYWLFGLVISGLIFVTWASLQTNNKSSTHESDLITKADDYYLQMRRQDNEMAIALYEQAVALRPQSGQGQAGLANALVQQVIRWPNPANMPDIPHQNLEYTLELGRTQTAAAKQKLERALALAEQAVSLSPNSARAHKSLGFVYSAQQKFDLAIQSYQRAVELDPDAWDALINIGDVNEIIQNNALAIEYFEAAFEAMTRVYESQSTRVQPWYADLGAAIGDKYYVKNQTQQAETWYRHVLSFAPFNDKATAGLATILKESGDQQSAQRLCDEFEQRVGKQPCTL